MILEPQHWLVITTIIFALVDTSCQEESILDLSSTAFQKQTSSSIEASAISNLTVSPSLVSSIQWMQFVFHCLSALHLQWCCVDHSLASHLSSISDLRNVLFLCLKIPSEFSFGLVSNLPAMSYCRDFAELIVRRNGVSIKR